MNELWIPRTETLPPNPDGMNDNRAKWARYAVAAFAQYTGQSQANPTYETGPDHVEWWDEVIGDLLGNLHHLADRVGIEDYERLIDRGEDYYAEETYDREQADTNAVCKHCGDTLAYYEPTDMWVDDRDDAGCPVNKKLGASGRHEPDK